MNSPRTRLGRLGVCTAVLLGAAATVVTAQFIPVSPFGFDRGQDVSPTFDGWVRNADGTYSFYFGYLNRNAAEEIYIPVGPDNTVEGGPDRGQPTYFYPSGAEDPAGLSDRDVTGRRRWWVFKIVAPKEWRKDQRITWTLKSRGRTNQAAAWLQPEYEVTDDFIRQNAADGHLFGRGEFDADNKPPTLSGGAAQTVALPQTATLRIMAADDGRPQPPAQQTQTRRQPQGLRFRWTLYRGPARVTFTPETSGPFSGNSAQAETKASFSVPGTYRLRTIASDGQLFSTYDVEVTVNPIQHTAR